MFVLRTLLFTFLSLALVRPAWGQIVSYVDERGKRVFTNVETAERKPTKRNPLALPQATPRFDRSWTIPSDIHNFIDEIAARQGIDPKLVRAIIQVESNWNPLAMSSKGAMGLMQLIPTTATRFGAMNIFDPKQNIAAGTRYLRFLLDLFRGDLHLSLAAYNAGENAVLQSGGIPAYRETRDYVEKVTSAYTVPGGSGHSRMSAASGSSRIYRSVDPSGRVVFTNF